MDIRRGGGNTYETPPAGEVPGYGHEYNIAKEAYQRAVAELTAQRAQTLLEAGYSGQYSPEGRLTGVEVDPWNPFGTYQQLLQSAAQDSIMRNEETVARGLDGPGLGNQTMRDAAWGYGAQSAAFGQALQSQLGNIQRGRSYADNEWATALAEAELAATRAAIASGSFNPGNVGGGGGGGNFSNGGAWNPNGAFEDILGQMYGSYGTPGYAQGAPGESYKPGPPGKAKNTAPPGRIVRQDGRRFVKWQGKLVPIKKWITNHPKKAREWGLI